MKISLLLADIESFVAALFMVVAFFGWIVNLVGKANQAKPVNRRPGPGKPPQPGKTIQNEIERFLEQARQAQSQTEEPRKGPETRQKVESLEVPREPSVRKAPPTQQRSRSQREIWEEQVASQREQGKRQGPSQNRPIPAANRGKQSGGKPKPVAPASRPGQNISGREFVSTVSRPARENTVGGLKSNIGQSVSKDITSNVQSHLGSFAATAATSQGEQLIAGTTTKAVSPALAIAQRIRTPQGMRDAILINEILTRPRALQKRS